MAGSQIKVIVGSHRWNRIVGLEEKELFIKGRHLFLQKIERGTERNKICAVTGEGALAFEFWVISFL